METFQDADVLDAIKKVREYLHREYIVDSCRTDFTEGCASCAAVLVDQQLLYYETAILTAAAETARSNPPKEGENDQAR